MLTTIFRYRSLPIQPSSPARTGCMQSCNAQGCNSLSSVPIFSGIDNLTSYHTPGSNNLVRCIHVISTGHHTCREYCYIPLQLFELNYTPEHESTNQTLRSVCISAAVDSAHTVLLIRSKDNLGTEGWEKVCQIMEEGIVI